ncbi:MAG: SRPBCC domain-containing protein, partial [Chloroflexi bacterium]|nr:SRPBCC domain-containing protein [Chloroflexota bacterium]
IDRPRWLVYASSMRLPDGTSVETRMEVTFEEENGRTRLTLVQRGFPTAARRDEFAGGWPSILDALGRVVTGCR